MSNPRCWKVIMVNVSITITVCIFNGRQAVVLTYPVRQQHSPISCYLSFVFFSFVRLSLCITFRNFVLQKEIKDLEVIKIRHRPWSSWQDIDIHTNIGIHANIKHMHLKNAIDPNLSYQYMMIYLITDFVPFLIILSWNLVRQLIC